MATRARIQIAAVDGSNDDWAINTLAQLSNSGLGGESSYLWVLLEQPAGAADALSNTTIANPTLTPRKEGCYVVKLTVNLGIAGEEKSDTQILRVLQVKSRKGIPGAGETTQADAARGWATRANALLQYHDDQLARGGFIVAQTAAAGLVAGTVVRFGDLTVLKAGLPGEESVPTVNKALATSASAVDELLGVIESDLDGGASPGSGVLVRVRTLGVYGPVSEAGSTVGDPVYVTDTGTLSLADGTNSRVVGHVVEAGATEFYVMFCGSIGVGGGAGGGTVTSVTFGAGITQAGTAADPVGNIVATDTSITVGVDSIGVNFAHAFAWTVGHGWTVTDATVNAITDIHTITHRRSAGTAAAGFGTGILLRGDDDANNLEDMARVGAVWVTPTNAAEASAFVLQLRNAGAALSEVARISGLGGFVMANMTAGTNATADMITVTQSTSGVAAAGFGSSILFRAENATSPNIADQARLAFSWTTATHTAETSAFDLSLRYAGATVSYLTGGVSDVFRVKHQSANTNTVRDVVGYDHMTSGTAAAGYGIGILFRGEDAAGSAGSAEDMGRSSVLWTTATAGSEASDFTWQTRNAGAALAEVGRFSGVNGVTSTKYGSSGVAGLLMRGEYPAGDGGSGTVQDIAWMKSVIADATNGSEDSTIEFQLRRGGAALATYHTISHGAGVTHLNSAALTATTSVGYTFQHKTSGAATTGFGTDVVFQLADNGGISASQVDFARMRAAITGTGETGLIFSVVTGSYGTVNERFRVTNVGARVYNDAAATNSVTDLLTLTNIVSGSALNGSGSAVLFKSEDSAGNEDDQCRLSSYWSDVTSTSEDSAFKVQLRAGGAALADVALLTPSSMRYKFGGATLEDSYAHEIVTTAAGCGSMVRADTGAGVGFFYAKADDAGKGAFFAHYGSGNSDTFCGGSNTSSSWIKAIGGHLSIGTDTAAKNLYMGAANQEILTLMAATQSAKFTKFFEMTEMTAPSAPPANGCIVYAVDNGSGKTQLMALFSSGAAQQLALQP